MFRWFVVIPVVVSRKSNLINHILGMGRVIDAAINIQPEVLDCSFAVSATSRTVLPTKFHNLVEHFRSD